MVVVFLQPLFPYCLLYIFKFDTDDLVPGSLCFQNDRLEGWLHSVDLSIDVGARVRLAVIGGVRDDESLLNSDLDDSVTWYGLDVDIDLGRRIYLMLSAERSEGDFEEYDQLYATLACRF